MIIACVIAFNEEQMLPGCLASIEEQVDRIVVVDGAYKRFPHEFPWSTDKTREIALCYGAEVIGCPVTAAGEPRAWANEVEKRSAMLAGREGDWYFQIDADERLVGALPDPEDGVHYALQVHARGRVMWAMRIWQHRGVMRYEGAHNALWSDDRLLRRTGAVRVDPGRARLMHLRHLRDADRLRAKRSFTPGRIARERAYREAYDL